MNHILNSRYEIVSSYAPRSYESNFRSCLEKPEKLRTSTVFVSVTSRYRCDTLTN